MNESFFFMINLILLVGLILLIFYESRQIIKYKEMMQLFIDSNSEVFGVVNVNADVTRRMADKLNEVEVTVAFLKMIADAHAHALRISNPVLPESLSDQIKSPPSEA